MPKVGKKHYPYTPQGMSMAKNAAKKAGTTVQYKKKGGTVKKGRKKK